ncbi:MAG: AIPR family protein [Candidatus Methanoperedens sp.]|nr:AIPR family protein [Candidatus Methanoperedens sp.]
MTNRFKQVRGNVNKGIRKTIIDEPHMFLAYNNGLSATAEKIEITSSNGESRIKWARDFQIVNGGQTTASIYHAYRKDKADVSNIYVQVKLTVLKDSSKIDSFVPKISLYANSQNKVSVADFSANNPFHIKLEELSRTVWAPAPPGMQLQTRWYYERARGQYLDEKGREGTPARKKAFEATNPTRQKFTKTDLAKFENTWNQLPHIVSRGAEKNFMEFMALLQERGEFQPDRTYYERLIAKAILFRQAEKLVQKQQYGGYRANIVTYTLTLISNKTAQRIDLDRIWKEQVISPVLMDTIIRVSEVVHRHIINPPGGRNITEWCKKEQCWKDLLALDIKLPDELENELIQTDGRERPKVDRGIDSPDGEDREKISEVMKVPADAWFRIARWAKETGNLQPWQRSLSFSLGNLAKRGREPSRKQAVQALIILEEARRLGFEIR